MCSHAHEAVSYTHPEAPGSAVDFIITAAREYGPDLTIVPTGAMTTMATVFRNAPDLKDSGVNVTLMGGALTLPGNVSPAAEATICLLYTSRCV